MKKLTSFFILLPLLFACKATTNSIEKKRQDSKKVKMATIACDDLFFVGQNLYDENIAVVYNFIDSNFYNDDNQFVAYDPYKNELKTLKVIKYKDGNKYINDLNLPYDLNLKKIKIIEFKESTEIGSYIFLVGHGSKDQAVIFREILKDTSGNIIKTIDSNYFSTTRIKRIQLGDSIIVEDYIYLTQDDYIRRFIRYNSKTKQGQFVNF